MEVYMSYNLEYRRPRNIIYDLALKILRLFEEILKKKKEKGKKRKNVRNVMLDSH